MKNFNEIFRKNVTYDNIKSDLKSWLHLPSKIHNSGKTTGGVKLAPLSVILGLRWST